MTPLARRLLLSALVLASLVARGHADSAFVESHARLQRIRTTNRAAQGLIEQGVRTSATFRALVDRLEHSDLVVYVEPDLRCPRGLDGRMTFVSSAGGRRYVLVRIRYATGGAYELAMLGHELQHAAEVADTPTIVDVTSLARAYARLGHESSGTPGSGRSFDTELAVHTGTQILREVRDGMARNVQ